MTEYTVTRKLHEQSGSYLVALPKIWVEAHQLKDADPVTIRFNGNITIEATKTSGQGDRP
jgi:antitoxin component of MazEF toxin-antitoxin module